MRRFSTQAERDLAIDMRERGCTPAAIAAAVGFSRSAVNWWLLEAGAERPTGWHRAMRGTVQAFRRGQHVVHRFTREDDVALLRLERMGLSYSEIAARLTLLHPARPRKRVSVLGRVLTLARQQQRKEARRARSAPPPRRPDQQEDCR